MEFFKIVDRSSNESEIQKKISPENIGEFAESMIFLGSEEAYFLGFTLWGEFKISYQKIKGGVRFTLLNCPNALAWTITTDYPPSRKEIVIQCTINRTKKNAQFIEEIEIHLEEWAEGIMQAF